MSNQKPKAKNHAQLASHTPGRIRFKLLAHCRDRQAMEGIGSTLRSCAGIRDVRLNPACGSVTVHYDNEHHSMAGILSFLEDLDVAVESIAHVPSIGEEGDSGRANGHSPGFIDAINDLNQRLRQATGLPVNLKLILPLAFVGAGVWSIGKKGLMVESVPGWLFLWFAFDMFVKLHPVEHRQP